MKDNTRNSSIELLRIVSMIGVVILHYNGGGAFRYVTEGSVNEYYLYATESVFICAVNVFIMISAYFLCTTYERKFIKVVELIMQVVVFNYIFYFLDIVSGGREQLSIKGLVACLLPCNYFVVLYCVLYSISPYINKMIVSLDKKQFKRLIVLLMLLFSFWSIIVDFFENYRGESLNGLSTVGLYGSQYGYSIVNFVLIYFVGAYIRINEISIKKNRLIANSVFIFLIIWALSLLEHKAKLESIMTWNYNNPMVIAVAALVVLLITNVNFKSKHVNEFAKGAFTCYLFHGWFISKCHIEGIVNKPIYFLVVHQIIVAIVLYIISFLVYKVYVLGTKWFIKLISPLCDKVDIYKL